MMAMVAELSRGGICTTVRGGSSPLARNASKATPLAKVPGGGSVQGSFANSASSKLRRRVHGFCIPAATTTESLNSGSATICSSVAAPRIQEITVQHFALSVRDEGPAGTLPQHETQYADAAG